MAEFAVLLEFEDNRKNSRTDLGTELKCWTEVYDQTI